MKSTKILLGGLAGGIIFFFLGWLIYGVLLKEFMTNNFNQCAARPMQEMIWGAMILSNLGFGFLISFVFSWSNSTSIMSGAKVGGVIGFLVSLSIDLSYYAMTTMISKLTAVFVDIIATTVMAIIAGVAVAWVMGMRKR